MSSKLTQNTKNFIKTGKLGHSFWKIEGHSKRLRELKKKGDLANRTSSTVKFQHGDQIVNTEEDWPDKGGEPSRG